MANGFLSVFFDGFTGGSLLGLLRRPNGPTQLFADAEQSHSHSELVKALIERDAEAREEEAQQEAEARAIADKAIAEAATVAGRRIPPRNVPQGPEEYGPWVSMSLPDPLESV
jgi:hypothetical protein